MLRKLFYLVQLALLVLLVYWLFKNPGQMSIHWFGMRLDMEVSTFVLAALLALSMVILTLALLKRLFKIPANVFQRLTGKNEDKAMGALYSSLENLFCQDYDGCIKAAQKASSHLNDKAMPQLLEAQALLGQGDSLKAEYLFYNLSHEEAHKKAGLMGLFLCAFAQKDATRMWEWARALSPMGLQNPVLLETLTTLYTDRKNWADALATLESRLQRNFISPQDAAQERTHILLMQCQDLQAAGRDSWALDVAQSAHDASPSRQTAHLLVPLLLAQGHPRRAKKLLKAFLTHTYDDSLFATLASLESAMTPTQRFGLLEDIASSAQKDHLKALCTLGLEAHLWGKVRHYLDLYEKDGDADTFFLATKARVCLLEDNNTNAALALYEKACAQHMDA